MGAGQSPASFAQNPQRFFPFASKEKTKRRNNMLFVREANNQNGKSKKPKRLFVFQQ
jgi:hypothetical protein